MTSNYEIFKNICKICEKYGLERIEKGCEISYYTNSSTLNLCGEVIRIFKTEDYVDYDYIVFFNKLEPCERSKYWYYDYVFNVCEDTVKKFGLEIHNITYDYFKKHGYDILEYIIKDAIKQKKYEELKIKTERIKNDF